MSGAVVRIPTPLRPYTAGADEVRVEGVTVRAALDDLGRRHAGILERILDAEGRPRGFVNVFVGESDVRSLGGLDARLDDEAVISIVPAVAGGRP